MLIKEPIISAIIFWGIYQKGLTTKKLIQLTGQTENRITQKLKTYKHQGLIHHSQNQWHQNKLKPAIALEHQKLIDKHLPLTRFIPGVKAIAVCNSHAMSTSNKNSDIDLFIVLNNKIFFTSRALITLYFKIIGLHRNKNKISNRFCLSFFISDQQINLQKATLKHDIYFYYWFLTLQWYVITSSNWLEKFTKQNLSWLNQIGPFNRFINPTWQKESSKNTFLTNLLKPIEPINRYWQLKRAKIKNNRLNRPQGVIIDNYMLKFHVVDKRAEINQQWHNKIQKSGF